MINKEFKRDWKYGGEVNILETNHFSLDFDKDYIGLSISFSPTFRIFYARIIKLVIRIY